MSTSFFKKSFAAANIKITAGRGGGRSFEDGGMDDDYERRSYGGEGPRTNNYRGGRGARGRNNRGGRGRGGRGGRDFSQHDDRDERSVTQRLGDRLGYKGRGRNQRGRRGGFSNPRQDERHDPSDNSPKWYQVTVPYGKKAGKDFVYQAINDYLDVPFQPTSYREDGQCSVFYVEMSYSSIQALKTINKRVTLPSGFKMMLTVKQLDPPVPKVITGELLEKLIVTMSSLYDTDNKVLDLTALHKHEGLKPECLPLNRDSVMTTVVNIILEHIPELIALNLSSNRLSNLAPLSALVSKTPNMLGLDLSNNDVKESDLDKISGWKLKEINLSKTPIAKKFSTDTAAYLTSVRKKFPNILVLDGNEAPAPIGFDIDTEEAAGLPARKGNFFAGVPEIQNLITQFVKQYIEIFDSDNRQPLLQAYHENVTFSTSFWFYPHMDRQARFDIANSRNLLKIPPGERNSKRIQYGNSRVVGYFVSSFPKTNHLLESLTVDVVHQSPQLLSFTLMGLYEEPNPTKAHKITRMFSRNFTAVPQGAGIVIISEQFMFTNASPERRGAMLAAGKQRMEMESAAAVANSAASTSTAVPANEATKKAMLEQFMRESSMNAYWSEECLKENNWDYVKSAALYAKLKADGKIPPEAFVR